MSAIFFCSFAFLSSKSLTSSMTASSRVTSCWACRFFSSCSASRDALDPPLDPDDDEAEQEPGERSGSG